MKRRGLPVLSPEEQQEQDELAQLSAVRNRINKLKRKFEAELDPIQDRIDVLDELQAFVATYVNSITTERNTIRIELRAERERVKALEEEIVELRKQSELNKEVKSKGAAK